MELFDQIAREVEADNERVSAFRGRKATLWDLHSTSATIVIGGHFGLSENLVVHFYGIESVRVKSEWTTGKVTVSFKMVNEVRAEFRFIDEDNDIEIVSERYFFLSNWDMVSQNSMSIYCWYPQTWFCYLLFECPFCHAREYGVRDYCGACGEPRNSNLPRRVEGQEISESYLEEKWKLALSHFRSGT